MKLLSISAEQMSQWLEKINRVSGDRLVLSVVGHFTTQATGTLAANNKRRKCGNIRRENRGALPKTKGSTRAKRQLQPVTSGTPSADLLEGLTVCRSGGNEMLQPNRMMIKAYIRRGLKKHCKLVSLNAMVSFYMTGRL